MKEYINNIETIEQLGEKIGYGHLMNLASAIWRKNLKENGYPEIGAFIPTCLPFIKDEMQEMHEQSSIQYDKIINRQ